MNIHSEHTRALIGENSWQAKTLSNRGGPPLLDDVILPLRPQKLFIQHTSSSGAAKPGKLTIVHNNQTRFSYHSKRSFIMSCLDSNAQCAMVLNFNLSNIVKWLFVRSCLGWNAKRRGAGHWCGHGFWLYVEWGWTSLSLARARTHKMPTQTPYTLNSKSKPQPYTWNPNLIQSLITDP